MIYKTSANFHQEVAGSNPSGGSDFELLFYFHIFSEISIKSNIFPQISSPGQKKFKDFFLPTLNTFLFCKFMLLGDYLSIGKWTSVFNAPRSTSGSVSCFPIKKTSVFVAWINPSVIPPKHIEGLSLILNPFSFESTLNYSDRNLDMYFLVPP